MARAASGAFQIFSATTWRGLAEVGAASVHHLGPGRARGEYSPRPLESALVSGAITMDEQLRLSHAPIVEGLIDFRVDP